MKPAPANADAWAALRRLTAARIARGRSGGSARTEEVLDFRLAHARARDAVLAPFAPAELAAALRGLGAEVIAVESAARDRAEYLRHPEAGRRLSEKARVRLGSVAAASAAAGVDLVIVVSDGLSTRAVMTQAEPLLRVLWPLLREQGWTLAPIVVARHARVALQDEIGAMFRARLSLMLLGERPGLGSADSLGAYFTHAPGPGRTDADRNCLSNIRGGGLAPAAAARKLAALLGMARRLGISGVGLKDEGRLELA